MKEKEEMKPSVKQALSNISILRCCVTGDLPNDTDIQSLKCIEVARENNDHQDISKTGSIFVYEFEKFDIEIIFDQKNGYSSIQLILADGDNDVATVMLESTDLGRLVIQATRELVEILRDAELWYDESDLVAMLSSGADIYFTGINGKYRATRITLRLDLTDASRLLNRNILKRVVVSTPID